MQPEVCLHVEHVPRGFAVGDGEIWGNVAGFGLHRLTNGDHLGRRFRKALARL